MALPSSATAAHSDCPTPILVRPQKSSTFSIDSLVGTNKAAFSYTSNQHSPFPTQFHETLQHLLPSGMAGSLPIYDNNAFAATLAEFLLQRSRLLAAATAVGRPSNSCSVTWPLVISPATEKNTNFNLSSGGQLNRQHDTHAAMPSNSDGFNLQANRLKRPLACHNGVGNGDGELHKTVARDGQAPKIAWLPNGRFDSGPLVSINNVNFTSAFTNNNLPIGSSILSRVEISKAALTNNFVNNNIHSNNFLPSFLQPPASLMPPFRPPLPFTIPAAATGMNNYSVAAAAAMAAAASAAANSHANLSVSASVAQNRCAVCNATFRLTSDLVFHMRSHHRSHAARGIGVMTSSTTIVAQNQPQQLPRGGVCRTDRHSEMQAASSNCNQHHSDTDDGIFKHSDDFGSCAHIPKRLRDEKLKCLICGEYFRERHHLTRHLSSHKEKDEAEKASLMVFVQQPELTSSHLAVASVVRGSGMALSHTAKSDDGSNSSGISSSCMKSPLLIVADLSQS